MKPAIDRPELPVGGPLTFLFTDVEGSTKLLASVGQARFGDILERHARILNDTVATHGGWPVSVSGDGHFFVFTDAVRGVAAAVESQRRLSAERWPGADGLRVRMGLHTGDARLVGADYVGLDVHLAARVSDAGHGGQVLVTEKTVEACEGELEVVDLGDHRLKDLTTPVRLYQLSGLGLVSSFPPLRTLTVIANNLPVRLTSFVGREMEVARVAKLIAETGIVTIVGTGGVGKTRLALQATAEVTSDHPDGVWWVELDDVSDRALVPGRVSDVLGIREQPGVDVETAIVQTIGDRRALLVLDNCEHLPGACASLVAVLVGACPELRVLATSREPLGVTGERMLSLSPLEMSDASSPEAIYSTDAVRLFCERVIEQGSDIVFGAEEADAISRIVQAVDGIPLGIELAAARTKHLAVADIASRLTDLVEEDPAGTRHGSLHRAIGWSYDMLSRSERMLFERLSVFRGGADLDAVDRVCGHGLEDDAVGLIARLVDRSMVVLEHGGSRTRYRVLEPLREFAEARRSAEDHAAVAERHTRWALDLIQRTRNACEGPEQATVLQRLRAELPNVRHMLTRGVEQRSDDVVSHFVQMKSLWIMLGLMREGRMWSERFREAFEALDPSLRGRLLLSEGTLAYRQGDLLDARPLLDEAYGIAVSIGDEAMEQDVAGHLGSLLNMMGSFERAKTLLHRTLELARCHENGTAEAAALNGLGNVSQSLGDLDGAERWFEEALKVAHPIGDAYAIGSILGGLGNISKAKGDHDRAIRFYEQTLPIWEELGDPARIAISHANLGSAFLYAGDHASARRSAADAVSLGREIDDKPVIWMGLDTLALTEIVSGDVQRGSVLQGAADAFRDRIGLVLPDEDADPVRARIPEHARSALGDASYEAARGRGAEMDVEDVLALAYAVARAEPVTNR